MGGNSHSSFAGKLSGRVSHGAYLSVVAKVIVWGCL